MKISAMYEMLELFSNGRKRSLNYDIALPDGSLITGIQIDHANKLLLLCTYKTAKLKESDDKEKRNG